MTILDFRPAARNGLAAIHQPRQAVCPVCLTTFTATGKARYCGDACRNEQQRRNARKRFAELQPIKPDRTGEAGLYRKPGSVVMAQDPDPACVAAVWAAAFAPVFALLRQKGQAKQMCECRVNPRRCARCGLTYCGDCKSRVHPVCAKGAKG